MKLDEENRQRQNIERAIYEEALEKVAVQGINQRDGLIVMGENWHPGVIGIVASRLVEKFYTPTIVLTMSNGICKGSGRSIEGFHLQHALSQCADVLVNYGGHSQAAGLGLRPEDLPACFSIIGIDVQRKGNINITRFCHLFQLRFFEANAHNLILRRPQTNTQMVIISPHSTSL